MDCVHCHADHAAAPRGLCWTCYYHRPGVRDSYPLIGSGRRGLGGDNRQPPLPPFATDAAPGSPEKIEVFEQRLESGLALFHPQDLVLDAS